MDVDQSRSDLVAWYTVVHVFSYPKLIQARPKTNYARKSHNDYYGPQSIRVGLRVRSEAKWRWTRFSDTAHDH